MISSQNLVSGKTFKLVRALTSSSTDLYLNELIISDDKYAIDEGDGATKAFNGTLRRVKIVAGEIEITDGVETFTDEDKDGNFVGDAGGTGTINYTTGAYSITFNANVINGTEITAGYIFKIQKCLVSIFNTYNDAEDFELLEITALSDENSKKYTIRRGISLGSPISGEDVPQNVGDVIDLRCEHTEGSLVNIPLTQYTVFRQVQTEAEKTALVPEIGNVLFVVASKRIYMCETAGTWEEISTLSSSSFLGLGHDSGVMSYAHGLGQIPKKIIFEAKYDASSSSGVVIETDNKCVYRFSVSPHVDNSSTYCIYIRRGASDYIRGQVTAVDATNVEITWTAHNFPTSVIYFLAICE